MTSDHPTMPSEFREIIEAPGYRFCVGGHAWSAWGYGARTPKRPWRRLKPFVMYDGRMKVDIKISGNPRRRFFLHRLVCWAWHGECPKGMLCRHLNGDHQDNRPENLRWGTHADNVADAIAHNRTMRGSKAHLSKLTDDLVLEIRARHAGGLLTFTELARLYGVRRRCISDVIHRKTWNHI